MGDEEERSQFDTALLAPIPGQSTGESAEQARIAQEMADFHRLMAARPSRG